MLLSLFNTVCIFGCVSIYYLYIYIFNCWVSEWVWSLVGYDMVLSVWMVVWMDGWFIYSDVLSVDSVADWYMKKFSFLILWKSKIWQQKKNGIFYHTFLIQKIYRGSKYFHEISFLPQMLNNGYYLMFFWQPKGAIFTQNA